MGHYQGVPTGESAGAQAGKEVQGQGRIKQRSSVGSVETGKGSGEKEVMKAGSGNG